MCYFHIESYYSEEILISEPFGPSCGEMSKQELHEGQQKEIES